MPITLQKPGQNKSKLGAVEAMLEKAKTVLLQERLKGLQLPAWVCMVRAGILMDNERMENANSFSLFPTASKFTGEPETNATYATARRALAGDYNRLMSEIRGLQPTDKEKHMFTMVYGEPGAL